MPGAIPTTKRRLRVQKAGQQRMHAGSFLHLTNFSYSWEYGTALQGAAGGTEQVQAVEGLRTVSVAMLGSRARRRKR